MNFLGVQRLGSGDSIHRRPSRGTCINYRHGGGIKSPTKPLPLSPVTMAIPTIATATTPLLHHPDFWLPESPVHDASTGLVHFPDIPARRIYTFDPAAPESLSYISPADSIGAVFLRANDAEHFLCAAQRGIAKVHKATGELEYLNHYFPDDPETQERRRANDAVVDSRGRIWVGVMRNFGLGPPQAEGKVFCCDNGAALRVVKEPVTVPNGIAFSPDGERAYVVDTRQRIIWWYPFDPELGALGEERVFVAFGEETLGSPDGVAVSEDGDLWVGMFNGSCVLRLDGRTAEVKGKVVIEGSRQVACPRFVGRSLMVTTGKLVHMDAKLVEECEHAGGVFWIDDVGVKGAEVYQAIVGN
jgi:sugar lactone lactonase YvrE